MAEAMGPAAVLRAIGAARRDNDLETSLGLIAAESLDQGKPATREDWRHKWEQIRAGCPDLEIITEHSMQDGEWLAHRYTICGTHTGELFGQPPTGNRFKIRGLDMVRVRDGQLIEHWAIAEPLPNR